MVKTSLSRSLAFGISFILASQNVLPTLILSQTVTAAAKPALGHAKVSLGVPTMRTQQGVLNLRSEPLRPLPPVTAGKTLLDEQGYVRRSLSKSDVSSWRDEIHRGTAPARQARLQIQLGELDLSAHEPAKAVERFNLAAAKLPKESPDRGLARFDAALCLYFQGRFTEAKDDFHRLIKSSLLGVNRRRAEQFAKHAEACWSYHSRHGDLGIPEPTFLDPLCGVSAMAVCLDGRGMHLSKGRLLQTVGHDGEGSSMQDLLTACPKLGLFGRMVTSDERGLKALPKPIVAHVEKDHFVAVTKADSKGVSYVCSDCGAWPGGEVRLDWKQWRSLEADSYLAVAQVGSAEALALRTLPTWPDRVAKLPRLAGGSSATIALAAQASEILSTLGPAVIAQSSWPTPVTAQCGTRGQTGECNGADGGGTPMHSVGTGNNFGAASFDPVNLATGEEIYGPIPDLDIYNPVGPRVTWSRSWNALADTTPNGWGSGWSHPYNLRIEESYSSYMFSNGYNSSDSHIASPPVQQVALPVLVLPNSARINLHFSEIPDHGNTTIVGTCDPGVPFIPTYHYGPSGYYMTITTRDRTVYTFGSATAGGSSLGLEYLQQITDRNGSSISLSWSQMTFLTPDQTTAGYQSYGLTSITNSVGTTLLSLGYANGHCVSANDCYGRSVYYAVSPHANQGVPQNIHNQSCDMIDSVSEIVPTGTQNAPIRYQYGYKNFRNTEQATTEYIPYINTITVPSATGVGTSTATITYNGFGEVSQIVDGNGNITIIGELGVVAPPPGGGIHASGGGGGGNPWVGAEVIVENPQGTPVYQYAVQFNSQMMETTRVFYDPTGTTKIPRWTMTYADPHDPYRPDTITDGNNRVYHLTWDQYGNLLTYKTPKGTTTTRTLSYANFPFGEVTGVQPGSKTATKLSYFEPSGLLKEADTPIPGQVGTGSTQATTYQYTSLGQISQITFPGNNSATTRSVSFGYTTDGAYSQSEQIGQPITYTDSAGQIWHYRFDSQANLLSQTDPVGNKLSQTYNIANQGLVTTAPPTGNTGVGGASVANVYLYPDGPTTAVQQFDESGIKFREVDLSYGLEGELLSQSGSTTTVSVAYNADYRPLTVKDGLNHVTTYSYDLSRNVTKASLPNTSGSNYDQVSLSNYDPLGRPLKKVDGNGVETDFVYADGDGLLNAMNYPSNSALDVSITYDSYDRIAALTDGTETSSVTLDDLDELAGSKITYTGLSQVSSTYSYYPDGSRSAMTNPGGSWGYLYDPGGRCTSMSSPAGTVSYSYFANSLLSIRTLPNDATTTYGYNALNILTSLSNQTSANHALSSYSSMTFDGAFNQLSLQATVPGALAQGGATTWHYDGLDRLTSEQSARLGGYTSSFGCDGANNLTTFKGTTVGYNVDNQRTSPGSWVYDGNGSPTTYNGAAATYDPECRLTALGGLTVAAYRADGTRAWKQNSSGKTYFLYDRGNPVVELNASGSVTAVNVFGPDGLVARQSGSSTINYTFDQQGNVAQRLDASQNVLSSSCYDAYGVESSTGSPTDPFGYNAQSGYYLDRETGLYLCQHRYYDPATGRWLTRDPIGTGGGMNLYGYCAGGPVGYADPYGYWSLYKWMVTDDGNAPDNVYEAGLVGLDKAVDKWFGHFGDQQAWAVPVASLGAITCPLPKTEAEKALNPDGRDWTALPRRISRWSEGKPWGPAAKDFANGLKRAITRPVLGGSRAAFVGETPAILAWALLVEAAAAIVAGVQTANDVIDVDPEDFLPDTPLGGASLGRQWMQGG